MLETVALETRRPATGCYWASTQRWPSAGGARRSGGTNTLLRSLAGASAGRCGDAERLQRSTHAEIRMAMTGSLLLLPVGGWGGGARPWTAAGVGLGRACYSAGLPSLRSAGLVSFSYSPPLIPPPDGLISSVITRGRAGILGICSPALYCKGKSNIHEIHMNISPRADACRTRTPRLN